LTPHPEPKYHMEAKRVFTKCLYLMYNLLGIAVGWLAGPFCQTSRRPVQTCAAGRSSRGGETVCQYRMYSSEAVHVDESGCCGRSSISPWAINGMLSCRTTKLLGKVRPTMLLYLSQLESLRLAHCGRMFVSRIERHDRCDRQSTEVYRQPA
jgi:hypothetical protein